MSVESRGKKTQIIENLQEAFSKCNMSVLTDYRGLTTSEMTALRRKLQESDSEYKVVKNTLARLAAARAGKDDLVSSLEGPIAIAFGYGDMIALARVLANYIRDSGANLSIKGAFFEDRLLTSEEVMTLSTLPSREILLAKMLGGMKSPIVTLVSCLANPIRGMVGVLQARINQLEEA